MMTISLHASRSDGSSKMLLCSRSQCRHLPQQQRLVRCQRLQQCRERVREKPHVRPQRSMSDVPSCAAHRPAVGAAPFRLQRLSRPQLVRDAGSFGWWCNAPCVCLRKTESAHDTVGLEHSGSHPVMPCRNVDVETPVKVVRTQFARQNVTFAAPQHWATGNMRRPRCRAWQDAPSCSGGCCQELKHSACDGGSSSASTAMAAC